MSERKSAEIKFRCTPTFKAGVQAAAEAAGQSMSEYIESAVGRQSAATEMSGVRAVGELLGPKDGAATDISRGWAEFVGMPTCPPCNGSCLGFGCDKQPPLPADDEFDSDDIVAVTATSWVDDEPPVDDEGRAVACTCRPWEFCTHKATG